MTHGIMADLLVVAAILVWIVCLELRTRRLSKSLDQVIAALTQMATWTEKANALMQSLVKSAGTSEEPSTSTPLRACGDYGGQASTSTKPLLRLPIPEGHVWVSLHGSRRSRMWRRFRGIMESNRRGRWWWPWGSVTW